MTNDHRPVRILVVENDSTWRSDHERNLKRWGYQPFIVSGSRRRLLDAAMERSKHDRCHLALVDMRLIDDDSSDDITGLELVASLQPTIAIVVSSSDDRRKAVAALREYRAVNFVGKEDGPAALKTAISEAMRDFAIGARHLSIFWSHDLSSSAIRTQMFPDKTGIPDDEIDDLIGRLFAQANHVRLTLVADDRESSDRDVSDATVVLRRKSRVFLAEVDQQPALLVVKLADPDKIMREADNFDRYVKLGVSNNYIPVKESQCTLWDVGAIAYRYIGANGLGNKYGPQTLTTAFRRAENSAQITPSLRFFFDLHGWGHWYRTRLETLTTSLVTAYDQIWRNALSQNYSAWQTQTSTRRFGGFEALLPNPPCWFVQNYHLCEHLRQLRQAITHGDLHGDNLFVDERAAWPIDFERTGYGPLLRDFVELIQDLTTRIACFGDDDLPLIYELAVAICVPERPNEPMQPTAALLSHPEARKLFEVVQELQLLAAERAQYDDRREYLWGLLCNHLFVASKLPPESPRWLRTMLFAAVICQRLDRWDRSSWMPVDWPAIAFVDRSAGNSASVLACEDATQSSAIAHVPASHPLSTDIPLQQQGLLDVSLPDQDTATSITHTGDAERTHLQTLRDMKLKRLHVLQLQVATFGIQAPPHVVIEMEELQKEIASLDAHEPPRAST